jgi:hypothetical protein
MRRSFGLLTTIAFALSAAATALPVQAQQASEVHVSTVGFNDIEFDWGRDGINCSTCNFGQGNARFNWVDRTHNLWLGHVDPTTGLFTPPQGNNELVDSYAYFWATWGNGPEWAFSTQNGEVVSQLVYTRFPRAPHTTAFADAAFATMNNGVWKAQVLPGAIGSSGDKNADSTILPEASQCNSDPVAFTIYHNLSTPIQPYTEPVTAAPGTVPTPAPFGANFNGAGARFVPCTHQMLFQGDAPPTQQGHIFQQVFWYDLDTQVVQQLTTDPTTKYAGFMFRAPDFSDNYIFFTIANKLTINVYEQTGTLSNGAPSFTLVNQIASPDPAELYMNSPEPFINCTPICTTYIFMTVSSTNNSQDGHTIPNGVAVAALNPAAPLFKILVPAASLPAAQRLDPEYFITSNGPYLYYQLGTVQSGSKPFHNLGEYYSDMQLGAPSGPCVGSSAEDGLLPGC